MKPLAFAWPFQFGDVLGPHLRGAVREQFRFDLRRMGAVRVAWFVRGRGSVPVALLAPR